MGSPGDKGHRPLASYSSALSPVANKGTDDMMGPLFTTATPCDQ